MINNLFSYEKISDYEANNYGCTPNTLKIMEIKSTDEGDVIIPEIIDGVAVTVCEIGKYSGPAIKRLFIPKTLVALDSIEDFPDIEDELIVDNDNPIWSTDGISLFSKDGSKLFRMCRKSMASYTIPKNTNIISSYAFKKNKIIELTIPDSVTTIEDYAFYTSSLKTIIGGDNLTNYTSNSFSFCEWYKSSPILLLGKTLIRFESDQA